MLVSLCGTLVLSALAFAPQVAGSAPGSDSGEPPIEMGTHCLAFLKVNAKVTLADAELRALRDEHLDYIDELLGNDAILFHATVEGNGELRELIQFSVKSAADAKPYLDADPLVAHRVLVPELHEWFSANGYTRKPNDVRATVSGWLGLLKAGKAPSDPSPNLAAIQKGHMANINRMAKLGHLALAGPLEAKSSVRGIFVFRPTPEDVVRSLIAEDPAVKAGSLVLELLPLRIAKGSLLEPNEMPTAKPGVKKP